MTVTAEQPGLLAPTFFSVGGKRYVAALFSDGATYALPPGVIAGVPSRRALAGDAITLYGHRLQPGNTKYFGGLDRSADQYVVSAATYFVGQTEATVTFAGLAPSALGLSRQRHGAIDIESRGNFRTAEVVHCGSIGRLGPHV